MIEIKRGKTKLKTSEGAFKLYYEKLGFKKIVAETEKKVVEKQPEIKKEEAPKFEKPKKVGDK